MPDNDVIYVSGEISEETRNEFMQEFKEIVNDIERRHGKIDYSPVRTFFPISDDKYEFKIAFDILCTKEAKEEFNNKMRSSIRKYNKKGLKEVSKEDYFKE